MKIPMILRLLAPGRIVIVLVGLQVMLYSSGCLKRVTIPIESSQEINNEILYVYLKEGYEYNGEWYLELQEPEFQNGFLSGVYKKERINIPLG